MDKATLERIKKIARNPPSKRIKVIIIRSPFLTGGVGPTCSGKALLQRRNKLEADREIFLAGMERIRRL